MRILHTSDWHLGIELHKMSLIEDQYAFFHQLTGILKEESIDVMIIAGDIYDTFLANKEAIQLFDLMMTTICKVMHIEVIIIAGNHDSGERLAAMSDLLHELGLHVYGRVNHKVEPLIIQDTAFYPIPFFHKHTFQQSYHVEVESYEEAYAHICKLALEEHADKVRICIAHTFCANAQLSESERFVSIGGSDIISVKVFQGFDYVALGHLHKQQQVHENVYYSGSPLPYAFSEAAHDNGVLIYDTQSREISKRIIQPLHPLCTYRGSFEQIQQEMTLPHDAMEYQKIEITDSNITFDMLAYMKEHFMNVLQLSGKQAGANNTTHIELHKMDQMSDLDIVKQYFKDYFDEALTDDEIAMFIEAARHEEHVYAT